MKALFSRLSSRLSSRLLYSCALFLPPILSMSSSDLHLSTELLETHKRLLEIQTGLAQLTSKTAGNKLPKYQAALLELENNYKVDGIWCGTLHSKIPAGQAVVNEIFDQCHDMIDHLLGLQEDAHPVRGGLIDQAKSRLGFTPEQQMQEEQAKAKLTGHSHHTDNGIVDQSRKKLENLMNNGEEDVGVTNEAAATRSFTDATRSL